MANKIGFMGLGLFAAMAGGIALGPVVKAVPPVGPSPIAQNGASPLTVDVLKNLSYTIPDQSTYSLNNGVFAGGTFSLNLIKPIAIGDVDQDGDQDAAVILRRQSVVSPDELIYLAVVAVGPNGSPSNPDTYFLGDRVRVQSLVIKDGQIRLNMLKHQQGDPECCPSSLVSEAYQLDAVAGTLQPITLNEQQRQEIHIQDLPSQALPGDQDEPFQPPLDQFQIQL
ncbi:MULTISPECIES: hypothetical protein [unclassified Synechocystis]|uniref:hypothetical protein n=1 Tax=unclassified Synechocystis TaxID=2640012 RepID=UPI0003FDDBB9|nr:MULTISPECIES: hypothetical protein [unclassified Synechocystis]AIE74596.1 hypothetical protein D082_20680 [Synechocystis sp. PCC 6714]